MVTPIILVLPPPPTPPPATPTSGYPGRGAIKRVYLYLTRFDFGNRAAYRVYTDSTEGYQAYSVYPCGGWRGNKHLSAFRVYSYKSPYGDQASIRVGIGEVAANRRGYNLVALEPSGGIQDRATFDTCGDPAASGALARWVQALPAGTIVLGAVKDDASSQLAAVAVDALATLGLHGDLRGGYRESHAFVGLKGARPGSALEALGPRAVEVRLGEPDVTFGMELVEFQLEAAGAH